MPAGQETSVQYFFQVGSLAEAAEYPLALFVVVGDYTGNYTAQAYNGTVFVKENYSDLDAESLVGYVFSLAVVAALSFIGYRMMLSSRKLSKYVSSSNLPAVGRAAAASSSSTSLDSSSSGQDENDWLAGTSADRNASKKKTPKRR